MRPGLRLTPFLLTLALSAAMAAPGTPADEWAVSGLIQGKKSKPATDISGIACAPEAEGARRCLVVDDETQFVQWVTVEGHTITAGPLLPLIEDRFDGKPVELDAEGAAFADGAFYVIGSYGAPRTGAPDAEDQARIAADSHLFRIVPQGDGVAGPTISDATGLRAVLLADGDLGAFADHELDENGLTIEGVAVLGDTVYVGFRGPVLGSGKDRAAVLPLPLAALFDGAQAAEPARVRKLSLGAGTGVRDLAAVGDKLLVLAGPIGNKQADHLAAGAYRLFWWDPRTDATRELFALPAVTHVNEDGETKPNKPEAILPLGLEDGRIEVLVLSDGPTGGAPTRYEATW